MDLSSLSSILINFRELKCKKIIANFLEHTQNISLRLILRGTFKLLQYLEFVVQPNKNDDNLCFKAYLERFNLFLIVQWGSIISAIVRQNFPVTIEMSLKISLPSNISGKRKRIFN